MNLQVAKQKRYQQRKRRARAQFYGTAQRPRLSVYRSLRFVYAQLIDDTTGTTLAAATDHVGKGKSKTNQPAIAGKTPMERAMSVGQKLAEQAKAKGITTVVFDRGGRKYHGRVKAVAEGARAAGLQF